MQYRIPATAAAMATTMNVIASPLPARNNIPHNNDTIALLKLITP